MKVKDLVPGSVHTITGFIAISEYGTLSHTSCDMTKHGYMTVAVHDINFTIPEGFNAVQSAVQAIDAKMESERGELAAKLQRLQAKKNELLQISFAGNDILDAE